MNILITICARGGSKGIPGKNIKELAGKPVIAYSINIARKFCSLFGGDIILSTDSEDILNVAERFGLSTAYRRPANLASDTAGKIDVIRHAWKYMEERLAKQFDYVLDLDVSSPLRTIKDLEEAFEVIRSNEEALNLFSVSKARRSPYFNMIELDDKGFAVISKSLKEEIMTRQSAPVVFELNASFYIYKRSFFTGNFKSAIQNHRSIPYEISHTCFDLDEEIDFSFMEYLILNDLLGFEI